MALTTKLSVGLAAKHTSTADFGTPEASLVKNYAISLASGTGAGQADRIFTDSRTLGASATEDLDLAGVLTDVFGATITFAKVKAVIVGAAAGNTNNVNVTRPASNGVPIFLAAGDGIAVRPGGVISILCGVEDTNGYAVTAGTGDLLTFTNSAGTTGVTYEVAIVGTSA